MNNYFDLKEAILDLSYDNSKKSSYFFINVSPSNIVEILNNNIEFDEWNYSTIPVYEYVYNMFINGGTYEIIAQFNFWYGNLIIYKNEK